jgi:hypothetical protein
MLTNQERPSRPHYLRLLLLFLALGALVWQLAAFNRLFDFAIPVDDFQQFWVAARLGVAGENFYDAELMAAGQKELAGTEPETLMMYLPPHVFPLLGPLAWFDYTPARLLWLTVHLLTLLICLDQLWRLYGGAPRRRWLIFLVGALFWPIIIVIRIGQVTPVILLGVVLFLMAVRRQQWFWAGAAIPLIAIKPQLFYLFWPALLFWLWSERRWSPAAGAAVTGLAALGVALLFNPAIVGAYLAFNAAQPPAHYASPTLGMLLRFLFGLEHFWLQFVPPLVGVAWFLAYWQRRRRDWSWPAALPLLLLVSMVTAAYGWSYDQILLLLPVTQMAIWFSRDWQRPWLWLHGGLYLLLMVAAFGLSSLRTHDLWFIWLPPALLLLYLSLWRYSGWPYVDAGMVRISRREA